MGEDLTAVVEEAERKAAVLRAEVERLRIILERQLRRREEAERCAQRNQALLDFELERQPLLLARYNGRRWRNGSD